MRRLGFARWKALHRLAYAAALLGVVHFAWRVKADRLKPAVFAAVIAVLPGAAGAAAGPAARGSAPLATAPGSLTGPGHSDNDSQH